VWRERYEGEGMVTVLMVSLKCGGKENGGEGI
jgi:hypothetical protein